MTHFNNELTDAEKDMLRQHRNLLNEYARISDGQTVEWEFDPTKIADVPNRFDATKNRTQFKIYDTDLDAEFKFECSKSVAAKISDLLFNGVRMIRITREGEGRDTRYKVEDATA